MTIRVLGIRLSDLDLSDIVTLSRKFSKVEIKKLLSEAQ